MKRNLILPSLLFLALSCSKAPDKLPVHNSMINVSTFVGREACKECHIKQYDLFTGSDHDMAMDVASGETVLGDFEDSRFEHHGISSRFFRRDNKFLVFTEGENGEMQEFRVRYVFGVRPLQQYVIEFPDGRFQMLPLCWDTRPKEAGGQRWFHIYDQEHIPYNDILHWTRPAHNWNYMCSECHSTNVRKNYDYQTGVYSTSWSEIDVSCEACHGPGSTHVAWAKAAEKGQHINVVGYLGLAIRLKDADNAAWVLRDAVKGTAERTSPRKSRKLIDMCGRCHSRRSIISEDYVHGKSLLDTHHPSVLQEDLYFSDGQIQDEVYVYGSFLQSKMYTAGVVCSDCHEPHSGKVFVNGNALCYRCHAPAKFGGREHHFHDPEKAGALCVECHMPERTYMVVDPRRDHSMRNPRPDLSEKLETPNACIKCHNDKTNRWATEFTAKWYGDKTEKHYGEVFHAARLRDPDALQLLVDFANKTDAAPMIRATALSLLDGFPSAAVLQTLQSAVLEADPLLRASAVAAARNVEPRLRFQLLKNALKDSVRLVRAQAAIELADAASGYFSNEDKRLLHSALNEYKQTMIINTDHQTAWLNLAILAARQNDFQRAEDNYKKAIAIEPLFPYSYINLADMYRLQNHDEKGERILLNAMEKNPDMADVHHALGLLYVRQQQLDKALPYLKDATKLSPETARFAYVYGVALNSMGQTPKAMQALHQALKTHPFDVDLMTAIIAIYRDKNDFERALEYASQLVEAYPNNQNYHRVLQQIIKLKNER